MGAYLRFWLMIVVSSVLMYGVMYLNTWSLGEVWFSETRLFMTGLMTAVMMAVMLVFMLRMLTNSRANWAIVGVAVVVFAGSLWLVRSQRTVGDVAWMKAMIPHHSIAILTSSRARLEDPRVRDLARRILEAQQREIGEMEGYIADLSR